MGRDFREKKKKNSLGISMYWGKERQIGTTTVIKCNSYEAEDTQK